MDRMASEPLLYDVFLCHNSQDKALVRELATTLKGLGLRVFFDEWDLVPGRPWQEALEEAIEQVKSAAILYGPSGIGPWANQEMRAFLQEFVRRQVPVIPVLLPGAGTAPKLPLFLSAFTWVDLRSGVSQEGIERLGWGITGKRPSFPQDEPRPTRLQLTFEFVRAREGGDPWAFEFTAQDYLLRQPDGTFANAPFPWDGQVLEELAQLAKPHPDREVVQRLGERLRAFLGRLDWRLHEAQLEEARAAGRPIQLTFRFAAAELFALPWECVTLKSTGQCLGELPECLVQYEFAGASSAAEPQAQPAQGGRLLFAWSAAGGAVPASQHLDALTAACALDGVRFSSARDVVPHVSLARLVQKLEESAEPVGALHLLCHGTRAGASSYGLLWDGPGAARSPEVIDAGTLQRILAPHAKRIRMVVLCACQSADPGQFGGRLGSVALALHRVGIPAVVASRLPMSAEGSVQLTQTLYRELLERSASLQRAISAARVRLGQSATHLDWASLQLYARADLSPDFRPFGGRSAGG